MGGAFTGQGSKLSIVVNLVQKRLCGVTVEVWSIICGWPKLEKIPWGRAQPKECWQFFLFGLCGNLDVSGPVKGRAVGVRPGVRQVEYGVHPRCPACRVPEPQGIGKVGYGRGKECL